MLIITARARFIPFRFASEGKNDETGQNYQRGRRHGLYLPIRRAVTVSCKAFADKQARESRLSVGEADPGVNRFFTSRVPTK